MPVFWRAIVLRQHGTSAAHLLYATGRILKKTAVEAKSHEEKIHLCMSGLRPVPKQEASTPSPAVVVCWNQLMMADAPEWTPPLSVGPNAKWEFICEGNGVLP